MRVAIFDTTLRDGTQGEGVNVSVKDKLKIAKKLDAKIIFAHDYEFFETLKCAPDFYE